ncbi:hypothetical protein [Marinitoga sp. 38H-ov]|uniref:hypothetical protein n=1 Tax=Marinitoga sp. 38H-ov TaxID=1755814 RepID=UPI0013ED83A6|nr:hypothetical protein [Marinitoga sp. 38H-ov]KAF2956288.1 hypothetical protein AS160_06135 [Marinitoga sp. 38H-ov]
MKNFIFLILIIMFAVSIYSFEISGSYLMELSGYERTFYGLNIIFGDKSLLGVELGVFSPPDIIETYEITYLQPTVFALLQIPFGNVKIFSGVSPIIQYYDNSFSLYSYTMYLIKGGLSIYLGPIVFTGGMNTVFDLSFQQTFGIYSAYGQFGLRF